MKASLLHLLPCFALLIMASPALSEETLRIATGSTPMVNIFEKVKKPFQDATGIKIVYVGDPTKNGADQVLKDLDEGNADAGAAPLPSMDRWLDLLREKKHVFRNTISDFKSQTVGLDRIQIVTFKGGPKELTTAQIVGLLSGSIGNWKDAGGTGLPVKIISSGNFPATVRFLESGIMQGKKMAGNIETLPKSVSIDQMITKIGTSDGALGFIPLNAVNEQVGNPKHPVIGRPILLGFVGTPKPNLLKLIQFIRTEGRKLGVAQ